MVEQEQQVEEEDPLSRGDKGSYKLYPSNILKHTGLNTQTKSKYSILSKGTILGFAKLFVPIYLVRFMISLILYTT